MKRAQRLGRGRDLDLLLRRGSRVSHPLFTALWRPNGGSINRFAFIVPRAVDKRATVRNRLRRRMSERMRAGASRLGSGRDIAILCRREAAGASRHELYAAIEGLLDRLSKI